MISQYLKWEITSELKRESAQQHLLYKENMACQEITASAESPGRMASSSMPPPPPPDPVVMNRKKEIKARLDELRPENHTNLLGNHSEKSFGEMIYQKDMSYEINKLLGTSIQRVHAWPCFSSHLGSRWRQMLLSASQG